MKKQNPPSSLSRWMIVLSGGVLLGLSLGVRHSQGLLMQPVTIDQGWSIGTFGLALALQNLVWGLTQPLTGLFADRFGSGRALFLGILAYVLGLYLMASAQEPTSFIASNGVLVGVALSGTAFGTVYGALSRIFEPERRSWAIAVAGAIGGLGQFCLVPFVQHLLEHVSWQSTVMMLSLLFLLSLPCAWMLRTPSTETDASSVKQAVGASIHQALHHKGFWLLNFGFFACGFQLAFIATYLPAYMLSQGLRLEQAATALALIALANAFGTYACSRCAGIWRVKYLLVGLYAIRAVAILLFISSPISVSGTYAFALTMGFLWLGTAPMTNELVLRLFGMRYIATLFGTVFLGHQVGGFFSVWLSAWIYERFQTYEPLWFGAVVIGFVAAVVHWLIDDTPLMESNQAVPSEVRP